MIFQAVRSCLIKLPGVSSFSKQFLHLRQNPSTAKYQYDSNWPCTASAMTLFSKLRSISTTSLRSSILSGTVYKSFLPPNPLGRRLVTGERFGSANLICPFLPLGYLRCGSIPRNCSVIMIKGQRKCTSKDVQKALAQHMLQNGSGMWLKSRVKRDGQVAGCTYCFLTDRRFSTEAEACEVF